MLKAHRIDNKKYGRGDEPSFNLWYDKMLAEWLNNNTIGGLYNKLNDDGEGEVKFLVEEIQKAINNCILEKETRDSLKMDVAWARAYNREYLLYECKE